jgi:hypothetical protein
MEPRPRPIVDLTTSCACGAVRVAFKGKVKAMFLCACEDCQKATGTGHSVAIAADPDDVTITGELASFARPADSGATYTRYFCPLCATPIYGISSRAPRLLSLPAGLFGGLTADWYQPTQMIFARSHREWDSIDPALPQHQTYRQREATT